MASSSCSVASGNCKKASVAMCEGCQGRYCTPHFLEHRQQIAQKVIPIVEDYNKIQEDIGRKTQDHPLMLRIAEWEKKSVEMIRRVADECRTDLQSLIHKVKSNIGKQLPTFYEDFKRRREEDDYAEKELKRWEDELKKLRNELEKPPILSIEDDGNKQPLYMIKVRQKSNEFADPSSCQPLRCQGRACAKCHKCRDWHFTGDKETWKWLANYQNWKDEDKKRYKDGRYWERFTKRDGATCLHGRGYLLDYCCCDDHCESR